MIPLLVCAVTGGCQHTLSPSASRLASELRQHNRVESGAIYESAQPSDVYAVYRRLAEAASEGDLRQLLDDRSPAVRVYAFMALAEHRPTQEMFEVLLRHLGDEQEVETQFGCIGSRMKVADLMIDEIDSRLSPEQHLTLRDWLIEHDNSLKAGKKAREEGPFPVRLHESLRRQSRQGAPGALLGLASYRDGNDAGILMARLDANSEESLDAAEKFPHPKLLPGLLAMAERFLDMDGWSREQEAFFHALAAYDSPRAREILLSTKDRLSEKPIRQFAFRFAFEGLILQGDRVPADMLLAMWEAGPMPYLTYEGSPESNAEEDSTILRLFRADPNRTRSVVRLQFQRAPQQSEQALGAMCRFANRHMTREEAVALVDAGLAKVYVNQLDVLIPWALHYKAESSAAVLFDLLVKSDNVNVKVSALKGILGYRNAQYKAKLRNLLADRAIPDWIAAWVEADKDS